MHIMNRGANHQKIFLDKNDYLYFLELLKITKAKYKFELHSYCLMPNHYHLLMETLDEDVSKIMKQIDAIYTRYFNVKYHRDGALFRGRFKSCEVVKEDYFLQTSRYISLNPVKAGIVSRPEEYMWSSFRTFAGISDDKITICDKTLRYFFDNSRKLYKDFVNAGIRHDSFAERVRLDIGEMAEAVLL